MSLSHSFSGVYSAHDFLAEKRRKLGFNSDSIKKRQKQKDSKTYTEFLSEHERLMSRTGLRLKEDLHGLTGIDGILSLGKMEQHSTKVLEPPRCVKLLSLSTLIILGTRVL